MRAPAFLSLLPLFLVAFVSCAAAPESGQDVAGGRPVVLVLVEGLTWEKVQENPSLEETFDVGAVANLSTSQGAEAPAPRTAHVLLGAGSRADTSLLPGNLPPGTTDPAGAFTGPVSSIRPGLLGETLANEEVTTAAIGERAKLVVMDREGRVAGDYYSTKPVGSVGSALAEGVEFVAVEAGSSEEAARISGLARSAGATVAVAAPVPPSGLANLTPFVLTGPGEGLLYSPTTRTRGLLSSSDVAPTLLGRLGIDVPPGMQGRDATVRPGTTGDAVRLGERISFVAEERFVAWLIIGAAMLAGTLLAVLWKGKAGAVYALLVLAALPAGALAVAAIPTTSAFVVAFSTLFLSGTLAGISWWFSRTNVSRISGVFLLVSALILADTISGGALMKLSTLGYNPAYGTRFYGIGNEYAAFLAGSLTVGIGALAYRRRLPLALVLTAGIVVVLALGLPTMGADVGGSLALGFGFGATVGLVRGARLKSLVLWAGGGLSLSATLFVLSGRLFAGVSHGSRAAGGETGLAEIILRKLLLSLDLLLNPVFLLIFVATLVVVYLGWRETKETTFGAGLLGATATALASGALNDSGILAAIYVLSYPVVAALMILLAQRRGLRPKPVRV